MAALRCVRRVGWLLLLLSIDSIAWGQMDASRDSVDFQGVPLRLGMAVEDVTSALRERNLHLEAADATRANIFKVVDVEARVLGKIRFAAGKVFVVSKDFDLQRNPAATLVSLLQELISEGKRNCALDYETNTEFTRGTQVAYLSCGTKSIKVYYRATAESMNTVEEVLER